MTDHCYVAADEPTILHRFLARLFPARYLLEIPEDTEGFAPSYIVTKVVSHLDWKDRLRVLISGNVHCETRTKTDVIVNKMVSESVVYVMPPSFANTSIGRTQ
jgi:hypothetical protein